ncbi:MAG: hypothetical protein K0R15_1758 [Clostridiales bacterium]|nr:hypothetical protein [Clostridiales bacterium]
MNRKNQTYKLVAAALLSAIGIIIPLVSPFKIQIEPASFTLASHVAIFIAMFISPSTAIIVSLGTTLGFFLGGFPIVIVLRALTHVVFASVGGFVLLKKPDILNSFSKATMLSFGLAILHALCEVAIVASFYFGTRLSAGFYDSGFGISQAIWQPLKSVIKFGSGSTTKKTKTINS